LIVLNLTFVMQAAESPKDAPAADLDKLVGQPVDLSPWAYEWRANRQTQEKPEGWFIPRRLERLDKVYRPVVGTPEFRGKDPNRQNIVTMLPVPKGRLVSGRLWLAPVSYARIELRWPEGGAVPPPEAVEVRIYPARYGWFGFVRDEKLGPPAISPDRRTWTFSPEIDARTGKPRLVSANHTDMIAAFVDDAAAPAGTKYACPSIRLIGPGAWKQMDVEIEWGFQSGVEPPQFEGRVEAYVGMVKSVSPLDEAGAGRRGIVASVLYLPQGHADVRCTPLHSRVTVWTKSGGFTFLPELLEKGPILVPDIGMFARKAGGATNARQFAAEAAAQNLKCIPRMTREHPEAASWEEVMQKVKLPCCPPGTVIPPLQPFQEPPDSAMRVHVPDERWTDAWRRSSWQLGQGKGGYGYLALEAARPIRATDLAGLRETSARRLDYWLKAPGGQPDGDFVDGDGGFEYAQTMKHGIGWSHDGTHPQTGMILHSVCERFFLTGDREWFARNRPRIQAAADWIIRQRRLYLKDVPDREKLEVAGLQPPQVLGDSYLGKSCWRWYLINDAFSIQGLRRFADALAELDPPAARKYRDEADAYAKDLLRVVNREASLAPVRPVRDGTYRRVIPASAYSQGSMVREFFGTYSLADVEMGALPLADAPGVLDVSDPRIGSHLDVVEELLRPAGKAGPIAKDDHWFYGGVVGLAKYSYISTIHLRRDDVPCFLRHWMVNYAGYVQSHGGFTEGYQPGSYGSGSGRPGGDLGSTGWFVESFRNTLVMEEGDSLWLAKATPRAWLEQGKKISVKNAPTYFGMLAYEIISDVDNGTISATVEMPSRKPPKEVVLRFRHPKTAPIKSVTVNGKPWTEFNKDKETITLKGLAGTVAVEARY
jgi:hypothetical protein